MDNCNGNFAAKKITRLENIKIASICFKTGAGKLAEIADLSFTDHDLLS